MDVLTVDGRDEALVDALVDAGRQQIRLVLLVLDALDVLGHARRIGEECVEHGRRVAQMLGELIELAKELFVAWDEAAEHEALGRGEPELTRGGDD